MISRFVIVCSFSSTDRENCVLRPLETPLFSSMRASGQSPFLEPNVATAGLTARAVPPAGKVLAVASERRGREKSFFQQRKNSCAQRCGGCAADDDAGQF